MIEILLLIIIMTFFKISVCIIVPLFIVFVLLKTIDKDKRGQNG